MANRDFPRTVFKRISIDFIEKHIPSTDPHRGQLLRDLQKSFPTGSCNVWGVPEGAQQVISRMSVGDYFLLLGLVGPRGKVRAMGKVKVFVQSRFLDLSHALWGEKRFPWIFYFDTETLEYTWSQFTDDLDYKAHWRPGGLVYSVRPEKLEPFRGAEGYIRHLQATYCAS